MESDQIQEPQQVIKIIMQVNVCHLLALLLSLLRLRAIVSPILSLSSSLPSSLSLSSCPSLPLPLPLRSSIPDFNNATINVTIPAHHTIFEIPTFFTVVDDNIDEREQSFAIVAEIFDVSENISCFQAYPGTIPCYGTQGATEIRITDNDCKLFHFSFSVQLIMCLPHFP